MATNTDEGSASAPSDASGLKPQTYLGELRGQWRPLLAAFIGLGSGFSTTGYVVSIMAPHLISDFGWSKSEFAMIGSFALISVPFFPIIGKLADRIGVRSTALIGIVIAPLIFLALSRMSGDIRVYITLYVVQAILCLTTTSTVYLRPVVHHIKRARGLALAIVASAPALFGVVGGPLLNMFVESQGWRAGYVAMTVYAAIAGLAAILLLGPDAQPDRGPRDVSAARPTGSRRMTSNPAFWILVVAMLLCNLQQVVGLTQLNLILLDDGVAPLAVSAMISGLAGGTLLGRFLCGLALDRLPSPQVAAFGMALTAIGLFLLASPLNHVPVQFLAVMLIGISLGAEGDLIGYLVVQHFGVARFSSIMGIMTAIISVTAASGAIILGILLKGHGGYTAFMNMCGVAVLVGSSFFLMLPKHPSPEAATG